MSAILPALLIGLGVGVVVGALGAGGGILSVPILVYILAQDPHAAATESLVIVIATAVAALPGRHKRGQVMWRQGAVVGLMSTIGAVGGSWLNTLVNGRILMALFAILLLAVAVYMSVRARKESASGQGSAPQQARASGQGVMQGQRSDADAPVDTAVSSWWLVAVAATITGVLTGFFGVGGGFVVVPMLTIVLGLDMRRASGTSLVVMIIAALASLAKRWGDDVTIDWAVTLAFMGGSMVGGLVGGPLSQRAKRSTLTYIFAALLLVVAVFTIVQTFIVH